jgi:uncharacterized protein
MRIHIIAAAILLAWAAPASAGPTPQKVLCDAAYKGTAKQIAAAAKKGADVNALCKGWGETPLEIAALQGNAANVNALLAAGAGVNQQDPDQTTALMLSHSAAVTRTLLDHGADPGLHDKYGQNALISAGIVADQVPEQDAIDMVQMLLDKGQDINATDGMNSTVLMNAIQSKRNRFIEFLLDHGADPNIRNDSNNTPLDVVENCIQMPLDPDEDLTGYRETESILRAHGGVQ